MQRQLQSIVVLVIVLMVSVGFATEQTVAPAELSIITGSESGTYYQFGKDLKRLAARNGLDLTVIPSYGSTENIVRLYQFPSIQLAMSQMDTLTYLVLSAMVDREKLTGELKNILESIQVVLPLYQEEVHLVATDSVKELKDLNGKKVAIGSPMSGTYSTALVVMKEFRIEPASVVLIDAEMAIEALRKGEIDAFFFVVGMPAEILSKKLTKADKVHLVPISKDATAADSPVKGLYSTAVIPTETYAWESRSVPTIAVRTLLVTSDRRLESGTCGNVGKLAKVVYQNLDWLRKNGHEKWKSVDLKLVDLKNDKLVSPCVANAFRQ